jgi:predicted component of type VI protein secretion system
VNRHVILMAALVCVLLSAACAVKRSESPLAVEPQTRIEVSVPQTVGPVVVGRWTKAGPYEVQRSRLS